MFDFSALEPPVREGGSAADAQNDSGSDETPHRRATTAPRIRTVRKVQRFISIVLGHQRIQRDHTSQRFVPLVRLHERSCARGTRICREVGTAGDVVVELDRGQRNRECDSCAREATQNQQSGHRHSSIHPDGRRSRLLDPGLRNYRRRGGLSAALPYEGCTNSEPDADAGAQQDPHHQTGPGRGCANDEGCTDKDGDIRGCARGHLRIVGGDTGDGDVSGLDAEGVAFMRGLLFAALPSAVFWIAVAVVVLVVA